jgi:hypothetical protein
MGIKNKGWVVVFFLFILLLSLQVSSNSDCPDDKKACLEYSTEPVCEEIPDEKCIAEEKRCNDYNQESERLYNDCIEENARLQRECKENNANAMCGGVPACLQKSCQTSPCSVIKKCYAGTTCIKWGCDKEQPPLEPIVEETICNICPLACELKDPNDTCGECLCPENHGFCTHEVGVRKVINNTSVYCIDGLWFKQKEDNQTCQNSFECLSNFCSKDFCYDISKQVEENKSLLNSILDWIKKFFRM